MKQIKLLVQSTETCLELLQYCRAHVDDINKSGIKLYIEKIGSDDFTDEMLESLNSKGITRLPAAIEKSGRAIIGKKNIIALLRNDIKTTTARMTASPYMPDNEDDLQEYMRKEMSQVKIGPNGKPTDDDDEPDEYSRSNDEVMKKMNDYKQRIPSHRKAAPVNDDDYGDYDAPARTGASLQHSIREEPEETYSSKNLLDKSFADTMHGCDGVESDMMRAFYDKLG